MSRSCRAAGATNFGAGIGLALSIPGGLLEVLLGIWLITKGFTADGYAGRSVERAADRASAV